MNKLTLLIDGGWITMRFFSVLNKKFDKNLPQYVREAAADELSTMIARSISNILNKFQVIDNIILTTEGGSWRKQLPIPSSLDGESYKSNRKHAIEMDWPLIYGAFDKVADTLAEKGATVSKAGNIEGDDWMWYWSRRLNSQGVNCLIWSSDADLKQLINFDKNGCWTAWYNDKVGLVLPRSAQPEPQSDIDFFMNPTIISSSLEMLKQRVSSVEYIEPDNIVLEKIIRGDMSDNIKSVVRYMKNGRQYRFSSKDWIDLEKTLNISNINDLVEKQDQIAENISNNEKYNATKKEVLEMLEYNTKLVWLHESQIPESIVQSMVQCEYKLFDITEIKRNYNSILPENQDIKSLFEDEDTPF